ncbi:MAG: M20/M25/M40 family metallo-hydrolase [Myxococcota bacterium]|nr:M20/M25/M40 family metallo-hydrolase [Myxococcota bacterium]
MKRRGPQLTQGFVVALALGGLLLCGGTAWAIWPFTNTESEGALADRTAELLSRMIQIPTVNPPGNESALAQWLVAKLRSEGIETKLIPIPSRSDTEPGSRAAVWARLPGNGQERPLILLSHLDVVPADASQWDTDPFSGEIREGWVYGRGALDAKGVTAVQVMALIELARNNTLLNRDLILLATPDEEAGGIEGSGYLVRNKSELLGDAEFLLTEGGSIRPGQAGLGDEAPTPPIWGVTITEKSPCWVEILTRGQAGHGSAPRAGAAVPRLIAALDRVRRVESRIRVLAEVEAMFLALAATAPAEDRAGFISLSQALSEDSAFTRRFMAQPGYNALVRNTLSITVLEGGPGTNVVPSLARAELDIRLLPGERCEDFVGALNEVIADPQVETRILLSFPSRSSPVDTDLYEAIETVAHRHDASAIVVPRMIGGFTDAHYFREKGIVSYGFTPRWLSATDASGIHGINERISVANLGMGVEAMIEIIDALASSKAQGTVGQPQP